MGYSTHDDQVEATACSMGAAFFEQLQHILERRTPDYFSFYCQ